MSWFNDWGKKTTQVTDGEERKAQRRINDGLFIATESLGFDIQQIFWQSKDNMKTFEHLAGGFDDIVRKSEDNGASIEEIVAGIDQLTQISNKLKEDFSRIEDMVIASKDSLNKNQEIMLQMEGAVVFVEGIKKQIIDLNQVAREQHLASVHIEEASQSISNSVGNTLEAASNLSEKVQMQKDKSVHTIERFNQVEASVSLLYSNVTL